MARPVSAHLFSSLNGVAESPDRFQFDSFGEAEGELMGRALAGVTDVVIGRKLWEEWSEYWQSPGADDGFGEFINPVRKHVVTTTRSGDLGWNPAVTPDGRRLFDDSVDLTRLSLVDSAITPAGNAVLTYALRR